MADVEILNREMFSEAEAARLLTVPQSTLHYWLEGGQRRGRSYRPIIRVEPTGARSVTWAEFVEAGLLRQYRRDFGVAMAELRLFIDLLRQQYEVPYPLAHEEPFVGGRQLVLNAQEKSGLDADYSLVAVASGQLILTAPSVTFVERVTWQDDIAMGWRPHDDPQSPVRMLPEVRFGRPSVKGVSTETLWEHVEDAGEDLRAVASDFDLDPADVRWAISYETSLRSA